MADSDDLNAKIAAVAAAYKIELERRYKYKEVCTIVDLNRKTVYDHREAGHLPHVIVGKSMRFCGWDIARYLVGRGEPQDKPSPKKEGSGIHDTAKRVFKKDE